MNISALPLDALEAIRAGVSTPDIETLSRAENATKALPESANRTSALRSLDRAIVCADNREWGTASRYAVSALRTILEWNP